MGVFDECADSTTANAIYGLHSGLAGCGHCSEDCERFGEASTPAIRGGLRLTYCLIDALFLARCFL